jgi:hypothetical protein
MGDEILKIITLILPLLLLFSSVMAKENKNKMSEYDKLFLQISKKRIGISNSKIDKVKNPFLMTYKKVVAKDGNSTKKLKELKYILTITFNKKAKINGKWYKLNSKLGNFKLTNISSNSVIIQNEHSKKELFIRKNDVSKIKFSSK